MSELATPVSLPPEPVELPKATPLDQAVIDATGIATVEELDAVKAAAAELPQVQQSLADTQTQLAAVQAVLSAKEAEAQPSVAPVRALIDQLEVFRITTLNETLLPLLSRAQGGEVLKDVPILTLGVT